MWVDADPRTNMLLLLPVGRVSTNAGGVSCHAISAKEQRIVFVCPFNRVTSGRGYRGLELDNSDRAVACARGCRPPRGATTRVCSDICSWYSAWCRHTQSLRGSGWPGHGVNGRRPRPGSARLSSCPLCRPPAPSDYQSHTILWIYSAISLAIFRAAVNW